MSIQIQLKNIHKHYVLGHRHFPVLKGIDLTIHRGDSIAIMGASGSGKSTLMNLMGLLDRPSSGDYYLKEQNMATLHDNQLAIHRNQSIGFVFQSFFLLPRLTALQNVCLPASYSQQPAPVSRAIALLERVGMTGHLAHRPAELSGGQQQPVAIARALMNEPDVLLADEPTGALDMASSKVIMNLFLELNEQEGKTLIIITHDPNVGRLCRHQIQMLDGCIISSSGEESCAQSSSA